VNATCRIARATYAVTFLVRGQEEPCIAIVTLL
jgi:hypothetical protein